MQKKNGKTQSKLNLRTISAQVMILTVVTLGWLVIYGVLTQMSNNMVKGAMETLTVVNDIEKDMSELRDLEGAFHLDPKSEQKDRFISITTKMRTDSEKLMINDEYRTQVANVTEQLAGIQETFNTIFDLQEGVGFTPELGLMGKLRDTVHDVEALVEGFDNQRLLVAVLQLRRSEKDFLLRKDNKYADQFKTLSNEVIERLDSVSLSVETKTDLRGKLTNYREAFINVVVDMEKLGLNNHLGMKKDFDAGIVALDKVFNTFLEIILRDAHSAIDRSRIISLTGLLIWILILGFFFTLIRGRMLRPLMKISLFFKKLAQGLISNQVDLTGTIEHKRVDEVGEMIEALNQFMTMLRRSIQSINTAASDLKGSSDNINTSSNSLASSSQEQSASITETSATLEEMVSTFRSGEKNINAISSDLEKFYGDVEQRSDHMNNVTRTMTAINDSSTKINSIVNVINDISFQTNLLALNAAVEAARAGEAGRGFAVVAAEVRNLAQKTAESSKSIQEIVSKNVEATRTGLTLTEETAEFFKDIITRVQRILLQLKENTHGFKEQTVAVEQLNIAISQLSDTVNENSNMSQSLSRTAGEMNGFAGELLDIVSQFRTEGSGESVDRVKKEAGTRKSPPSVEAAPKTESVKEPKPKSEVKTATPLPSKEQKVVKPVKESPKPPTRPEPKPTAKPEAKPKNPSKEAPKKSEETLDDFFNGFTGDGFEEF